MKGPRGIRPCSPWLVAVAALASILQGGGPQAPPALRTAGGLTAATPSTMPAQAAPLARASTLPRDFDAAADAADDIPPSVLASSAARPAPPVPPWVPEAPVYGIAAALNVPVRMTDGVILRANIMYPAVRGEPAPGSFPVLLTQTPYGKASGGVDPYLVQRGYIEAVVDVRGTGASHGSWGLLDPAQVSDGVALVHWAAGLPHSNGRVGLFGGSYLGINQLLTAAAVGPRSPLKAIFPMIAATDVYRDLAVMGGLVDREFDAILLGTTGGYNTTGPARESLAAGAGSASPGDVSSAEVEHASGLPTSHATFLAELESGGERAYDGPYWAARRPRDALSAIVDNGIPAYLVGGWHDIFQRGEPLNYVGLQNAWARRPVDAAMAPGQRVTGRYQLYMGPWYHAIKPGGVDLERLQLEWFDTWLRNEPTGMADTPTPLHLQELGGTRVVEATAWPLPRAVPQRWYLGAGGTGTAPQSMNDGALSMARPAAPGNDPVAYDGVSNPCTATTEQWSGGVGAAELNALIGSTDPCEGDDRTLQAPPTALTYTSPPVSQPTVLVGPIGATIYASSSTPDCEWVVRVEDVGPDGGSVPLTEGALLGSMRSLDPRRTWWTPDGGTIMPFHQLTHESVAAVPPDQMVRYDIEVLPTLAVIQPGHRLRITVSTSDTPHLVPNASQLGNLAGGVYRVMHSPDAASFAELPLAPETAL